MDLAAWRDLALFLLALFLMFILALLIIFFAFLSFFIRKARKKADTVLELVLNKAESAEEVAKNVTHRMVAPLASILSLKEGLKVFFTALIAHKRT